MSTKSKFFMVISSAMRSRCILYELIMYFTPTVREDGGAFVKNFNDEEFLQKAMDDL